MSGERDRRLERAAELYERAVFGGDAGAADAGDRELDAVEADVALARGRLLHARFLADRGPDAAEGVESRDSLRERELFERAVTLYGALGDGRGEGEALFWLGTYHQVVRAAYGEAVPCFQRAYELAESAGDKLTLSYATRHLGFADEAAGRTDAARARFEESVRLREEIGFLPGVAAGRLTLAGLLAGAGDRPAALRQLDQAQSAAEESGAHGVLAWIAQARAEI